MNKTKDIFNFLQTRNIIDNLFFNERPLEFEKRNFAIFKCDSIEKIYSYTPNMQYKCSTTIYDDDFNSLMESTENIKNLLIAFTSQKLNNTTVIREIIFHSANFARVKYLSQSTNQCIIDFSIII